MLLLYLLYALSFFTHNYSLIKFARKSENLFQIAVFSLITCTFSTVFFGALTGFSPSFNKTIVIFSLLYSTAVLCAQYIGTIIYKYMRILDFGLIKSALTLILTFLAGAVLYNEKITVIAFTRMFFSLLATVLLVLNKNKENTDVKNSFMGYLLCGVLIITSVFSMIISKEFANLPQKQDENSYFLLVNIICLIFSIFFIIVAKKGAVKPIMDEFKNIRKIDYTYIILSAFGSNMSSLIVIWILASKASLVLYTPLTTAICIIVQIITAKIIAKEKVPKLPIVFSMLSVLLSFFK